MRRNIPRYNLLSARNTMARGGEDYRLSANGTTEVAVD
jgi:hypothetical protein